MINLALNDTCSPCLQHDNAERDARNPADEADDCED